MRKIQKVADLQLTLTFSEYDIFGQYAESFHKSELGGRLPFAAFVSLQRRWA